MFQRVSEWLWKGPFASCTNKWSSSCHQSKIDNSSDISYSIFWILRGVGFPWDTNLSASLPLHLQRACWKIRRMGVGGCAGRNGIEWKKKKDLGGEKEKNDMEELFSSFDFISSMSLISEPGKWNCALSHDGWTCFPIPYPSRVIEIGFKTKIKMFLLLWTLESVICFGWELWEVRNGRS